MPITDLVCQHGDLLELCLDCTVAPPAPSAVPPLAGELVFLAVYPGQCDECNLPIAVDQRIARMNNGTYQHAACVTRWT